eukprot:12906892-Prorocentrum_lima.AAC.1
MSGGRQCTYTRPVVEYTAQMWWDRVLLATSKCLLPTNGDHPERFAGARGRVGYEEHTRPPYA